MLVTNSTRRGLTGKSQRRKKAEQNDGGLNIQSEEYRSFDLTVFRALIGHLAGRQV